MVELAGYRRQRAGRTGRWSRHSGCGRVWGESEGELEVVVVRTGGRAASQAAEGLVVIGRAKLGLGLEVYTAVLWRANGC